MKRRRTEKKISERERKEETRTEDTERKIKRTEDTERKITSAILANYGLVKNNKKVLNQ